MSIPRTAAANQARLRMLAERRAQDPDKLEHATDTIAAALGDDASTVVAVLTVRGSADRQLRKLGASAAELTDEQLDEIAAIVRAALTRTGDPGAEAA